jgi:hypothetical protein
MDLYLGLKVADFFGFTNENARNKVVALFWAFHLI